MPASDGQSPLNWTRWVGPVSFGVGAAMLGSFFVLTGWHQHLQAQALRSFEEQLMLAQADLHANAAVADASSAPVVVAAVDGETPDTTLWSEARVRDYQAAMSQFDLPVEGILSIQSVDVRVPVFGGTGGAILDVGAGRIEGTPEIGAPGNVGVAAHRDGHFRGLKDIEIGAEIVVETTKGRFEYEVFAVSIVDPEDVYVLDPTADAQLTLVTCYPFYFVGSAPQRFIVHARVTEG